MSGKLLGVLGGMGPAATVYYFERVISLTNAKRDQDHIPMLVYNYTDILDRSLAVKQNREEEFKDQLINAATKLVSFGAVCVAIPCNGASSYIPEIQPYVPVPIIDMILETVKKCSSLNSKKVGILGTDATIQKAMYHTYCNMYNIEPVDLSVDLQKDLMDLIYAKIKAGKDIQEYDLVVFFEYMIKKGCDTVILACTELSLYNSRFILPQYCVDAMDQLVLQSIQFCGTIESI